MLFFQQHHDTVHFFKQHYKDWTVVPINKSPHYRLCTGDESLYFQYLQNSWRSIKRNKDQKIKKKIHDFNILKNQIKVEGCKNPVEVTKNLSGQELMIHGNHRASICQYFNLPYPKKIITLEDAVRKICHNKLEKFGSGIDDMPYHPILDDNLKQLIPGRRNDIIDRHEAIKKWVDLTNLDIVDFGSNTGAVGRMCLNDGAGHVVNVEISRIIINCCIRLAVLFNKKHSSFVLADLGKDQLNINSKADLAFCLSIHSHVNNNEHLTRNIVKNTKKNSLLIFETHIKNEKIPSRILDSFKIVDKFSQLENRDLYLLKKKK